MSGHSVGTHAVLTQLTGYVRTLWLRLGFKGLVVLRSRMRSYHRYISSLHCTELVQTRPHVCPDSSTNVDKTFALRSLPHECPSLSRFLFCTPTCPSFCGLQTVSAPCCFALFPFLDRSLSLHAPAHQRPLRGHFFPLPRHIPSSAVSRGE